MPVALKVVAVVAAVGAGVFLSRELGIVPTAKSVEAELVAAAKEFNANLPMMVDSVTRWDTTLPGPGRRLTYLYTLPSHNAEEVMRTDFAANLAERAPSAVCSSTEMKPLIDLDVVVVYIYRDKDGIEVAKIEVAKPDCLALAKA